MSQATQPRVHEGGLAGAGRRPLVLFAHARAPIGRAVDRVLSAHGFTVIQAHDAAQRDDALDDRRCVGHGADRIRRGLDDLLDPHDVDAIEAATHEEPAEVLSYYEQTPKALDNVRALVLEDQIVDWVLERAQVTERASTFAEIMTPNKPAAAAPVESTE